jgi:hypothetical protein
LAIAHPWQDDLDLRLFAWIAVDIELATQTVRDDAMDDMQAEASVDVRADPKLLQYLAP